MSINKLIRDTLLPLGHPVSYQFYKGEETTYIVYSKYNEMGTLRADDEEIKQRHSVQVSIFGKGDIESLATVVKNKMQAVGFERNSYFENFEYETGMYHKAYRFYYEEAI